MQIFSMDGLIFLLRYLHIFFGVIWIGLLYYFNFVHGSFMKEAGAPAKPDVVGKLLPRALWWFRWGAFWTMATGIVIITYMAMQMGFVNFWAASIFTGGILGLIMGANVWFIIWPNQKIVIKNNEDVAAGKPANPATAGAAAKAGLASRTNTFLSIPMLFFMNSARHGLLSGETDSAKFHTYFGAFIVIALLIEINAIKGKLGPLETIKGVITSGFVLTAILFALQACIL
jgi:uncharacterized membrane protein